MSVSNRSEQIRYTGEQLEAMAKKLRELPPVEKSKQHFSRQEAVTKLKAEIAALQKRGYSLEQVSEALKAVGIEIATPTLKSYLQRAKGSTGRSKTEKRTKPASTTEADAAVPSEAGTAAPTTLPAKSTGGRHTGLGRSVLPVQKESTQTESSSKGVFALKDDTDDI